MTFRFYVVMIALNPGLTIQDVQNALAGIDYYRIANNVWVVHTIYNSNGIYNRLTSLAHPSGQLFISRLDPREKQGWMVPEFWKWIEARLPFTAV